MKDLQDIAHEFRIGRASIYRVLGTQALPA